MKLKAIVSASILFFVSPSIGTAQEATGCASGTRCLKVTKDGKVDAAGTFVAQCSGRFPDFIAPQARINGWAGERFRLSQNYPPADAGTDAPWRTIDFRTPEGADAYVLALRDYAYEGMIEADFRPEASAGRRWYHMPMMNFGSGSREFVHGLTEERPVTGPELGLKSGVRIRDFAVGFYNAAAATTIARVWAADDPSLVNTAFPPGSMSFKVLFSTAQAADFADGIDRLAGAPTWQIYENGQTIDVRLMQMDVAAAAPDTQTGWVFGTLAYDASAADTSTWRRMRPVGLSWGNDVGVKPSEIAAGTKKLQETIVSSLAPAFAAQHLGWAGRMNGPVDNPVSGCLSCHGTSQSPRAPLIPMNSCTTEDQKLFWFRNVPGSVAFGQVDQSTCQPSSSGNPMAALDYSLQMAVAVQNVLQFREVNPCAGADPMRTRLLRVWKGDFAVDDQIPPESDRIQR
ncbi:hypothetical protein DPM33_05000 [Mesorhizobium hawassense]|uniref:Cytochrome c domain-containing protein n=1 Tax=Mesorhizobium hawassense TaxID=1209954 RepID=A0A330HYS1_9HYPH|nr:hypothetical protein [Mesorhizobium hawassense]RAZ91839.1 hypothetical protein DPM33_05000 [Mesorhizobium hawassense]